MELTFWIAAIVAGVVILTSAVFIVVVRAVSLGKRLKPFALHLTDFKANSKAYPEAVKFYVDLASSQELPAGKPRSAKADRKRP